MSSSSNNNISLPFSIVDELAPVVFGIGFNNTGQLESSNAQINEKLHNLFKTLKESVADSTSELKSPSTRRPIILTDAPEATRRSRGPTALAGQLTEVRFKLPEAFDGDGLDVEKLVPPEANQNPNTQTKRKFSFFQRLEGWSIERRWRSNGKNSDMYYRKQGTKWTFRSVGKVVRYIMYEEEPAKKKGKEEEQREDGSDIKRSRKTNLNHYNDSRVRKSHPINMEIGGHSHLMICDDFGIDDFEMIGDDERFYHPKPYDQELRANARFTTDDGPMVADGQSSYLGDEIMRSSGI